MLVYLTIKEIEILYGSYLDAVVSFNLLLKIVVGGRSKLEGKGFFIGVKGE